MLAARPVHAMAPSGSVIRRLSSRALGKQVNNIRGVVFDMDGTLSLPTIDFGDMRRRLGVEQGKDILAEMETWSEERRAQGQAIIADIEEKALRDMQVMPGALELCALLDSRRVPRALLTRNVNSSVEFFQRTHFHTLPPFVPALTREFHFYKPDPACLRHIAGEWQVQASQLMMIGDSAKDDVVCGNRAGAATVLLDFYGHHASVDELQGEERPDFLVKSLHQVTELLAELLDDPSS